MKNLIKAFFLSGIMVCMLFTSCSDMNELSDRFLKDGEISYAAMPDFAYVGAGKERVQFLIWFTTNRVKTVRIYWNNYSDSTDVEIGNQTGVFQKIVENLPEQSYLFNMVSLDQYGNKSLPYEMSGRTLGAKYESSMLNRSLVSINADKLGNKVLEWGNVDESSDAKYTEVKYTNVNNESVTIVVPLTESKTIIPDLKLNTLPQYRTVYIPDLLELDVFGTPFKDGELKYAGEFMLLKPEISIMGYSSQHDSGSNAAKNVLDNNYANRWHTRSPGNFPHWMAFNMGAEVTISRFSLFASIFDPEVGNYDTRLPASVTLWGRTDEPPSDDLGSDEGWTKLGEYPCENRIGEQTFVINSPIPVRYFKMFSPSGVHATLMVLGEVDFYSR